MGEQEMNVAKGTADARVECFWKAPQDIYADHCPLNACRNALCALISRGSKPLPRYFCTFFLQKGKFYAVFCTYEGRAGGLKLFFLWDFPFPKSSNYNTICSKLWLNNSQLPQSCRHCFPNQHQLAWSWDLCHLESLYSSLNINKQHIFQALEEKGYVQIVAIAAMRMCLDANRRS